jgi:hypothetical protein
MPAALACQDFRFDFKHDGKIRENPRPSKKNSEGCGAKEFIPEPIARMNIE